MLLKDRVAIVTGSGSGVGKATAAKMAEEGASLVINDVIASRAEETAKELKMKKYDVVIAVADIGTEEGAEKVVKSAIDRFGKLDILVNNAGIAGPQVPVWELSLKDWDELIRVNLRSMFLCTRYAAPYMMKQKWGRIINVASNAARAGNANQCGYSASKGGVISFTRSIARDLAPYNILANMITPVSDTPLMRTFSDEYRKRLTSTIPLGRIGLPEEAAEMIVFLASDKASYSTGQIFDVSGGRYI